MGKNKKTSSTDEIIAKHHKINGDSSILLNNGFLAVPVSILQSDVKHWLYVRQHIATGGSAVASTSKVVDDLPGERTLFVANLPVDTTESHVRHVFAKAGTISIVKFRRNVVKAEDGEEDEREEMGEGEDEDEGEEVNGEGEEQHHMITQSGVKEGNKRKKRARQASNKSKVPRVVSLPSLDPRESMGSQAFLSTASSAHIVFLDAGSLTRALELVKTGLRWTDPFRDLRKQVSKQTLHDTSQPRSNTPQTAASFLLSAGATIPPTGLTYLLDQYTACRPELDNVAAWANSRIALYQYRRAHPLPRKIGVRGVTLGPSGELLDQDGFTVVQRSGKYGRATTNSQTGGSVGIAKSSFQQNNKRKSEGLQDFYRFQFREKKRQQLADLRAKFQADKQKVAKLKQARRFKPY